MAERRLLIDNLVLHGVPPHRRAAVARAVETAMTDAMRESGLSALPPAAIEARLTAVAQAAARSALAGRPVVAARPAPGMPRPDFAHARFVEPASVTSSASPSNGVPSASPSAPGGTR